MAPLRLGAAALALAISTPGHAQTVAHWRPYIAEASRRFGIPAAWIERVMRAESNGRTRSNGRPIRSPAGAIGLMQLMPGTWQAMRTALGLGADPDDPHDNILAGAFYLRLMYDRFGYPGLFAAYNAGPGRYAAHLASGTALPGETIAYMTAVRGDAADTAEPSLHKPRRTLFAVQRRGPITTAEASLERSSTALFAVRHDGR